MRKYLLHVLIISFVFLLAPTAQIASSAETYEEYSKRMDEERAVENAKEEVRKNPDDARAHYFLGNAYSNSGKYQKAIKSYKQAIRIDPDLAGAHCGLGDVYVCFKDRDSALEQYKILKSLDTEMANKLFNFINE
jgi:cytochrome c-type biogenesis protein CcmH/NrfG